MAKERNERTEQEIIVDDDFEWDGYQVVRREFFSHVYEASVKFSYTSISFNSACLRKLPDAMYVQVLVNRQTKQLMVKECSEDSKDAVRWCTIDKKTGKHKSREIKGAIFSGMIFDMMGWNINYRYKLLGTVISVFNERIILFRLEDCETYVPVETGEDGSIKKMGRRPHYPSAWKDSFGLPIEEHANQLKIDVLDNFARYEVVRPKTTAPPHTNVYQERLDLGDGGGSDGN